MQRQADMEYTQNCIAYRPSSSHKPFVGQLRNHRHELFMCRPSSNPPPVHHHHITVICAMRPGQPTERSSMLLRLSCRWVKWVYHYQFIIRMVFWLSHYHFCDCMCVPHKTCSCAAGVVRGCFSRLLSSCWRGGGKFEGSLLTLKRARLVHFVCYVFAQRFCLFASKWC